MKVDLHYTELTSLQVNAIFQGIADCEELRLKKLIIWSNNLATVPTDSLSRATEKLEEISLFHTQLTNSQVSGVLLSVGESQIWVYILTKNAYI